jgi:hypothetical protein
VDTLIDVISKHMSSTMRASSKLLFVMKKYKEATAVDLKKILGDQAGENSFTASSSSSNENSGDDAGSESKDEFGDMDADGMDLTEL